ncbi:unnamed protein product, partial [Staurois parvus]
MAVHSTAMQNSVKTAHSKQLTLCSPHMLTPSCPMPLVQCQCFLFALISQFIGVTGDVNDTKSVPPSVRMPATV